jgi:hypothetical protein
MTSWLLSTLRQQYASKDLAAFAQAAPHHWLLWEPGAWRPPRRRTMELPTPAPAPAPVGTGAPPAGEALAIAVIDAGRPLVLGRDPACDLFLNDATLSGRHLALHHRGGVWQVEDLGSTNGTRVNEVVVPPGEAVALEDGARLDAGQVVLTFYAPEGLWPRLSTR